MKAFPLSALSAVALVRHGLTAHAQSPQHHVRLTGPLAALQNLATSFIDIPTGRAASHGHCGGVLQPEGGNPCA
jgi:hypothetical protein